jgi:hypothetical protein
MSKRCSEKNKKGKRCGAWAVAGATRCALHLDPERASKLGSKSRDKRAGRSQTDAPPMDLPKTASDVKNALATTMVQVYAGTMDAKTANTLAYLGMSLLRAIEVSDIESRLDALEGLQRSEKRLVFAGAGDVSAGG